MIVGIDIGGSTTDAVLADEGVQVASVESSDPIAAAAGALGKLLATSGARIEQVQGIAATGGGARALGDRLLGIPVAKVPEITAIGVGGATQAGKTEALVVSMGTGTALVSVQGNRVAHAGGTGVGGGTLLGLAKHLLQVSRLETLERMAARGDRFRVDLTVEDVAGGPVGYLPPGATASNFGKLGSDATPEDKTPEDKASALLNMIAEVIVVVAVGAARAFGHADVILTGKLVRVRPLLERIQSTRTLFGPNFLVPPHAEVATAIGAARSLERSWEPAQETPCTPSLPSLMRQREEAGA